MNAEYQISCLADFALIPPDRLEACLIDFAAWLRLFRVDAEINDAATRMLGAPTTLVRNSFVWVDDGIIGVSAINIECDGELIGCLSLGRA